VAAVRRAYAFVDTGLREAWGDDPEWWLVEGVTYYRRALELARASARERPSPPGVEAGPRGTRIRG